MAYVKIPKLWTAPDFEPNSYEQRPDGTLVLKDWRQAELEKEMGGDDAAEEARIAAAYEKRRAEVRARRHEKPATPEMIAALDAALRRDRARVQLERMGVVLPPEGSDGEEGTGQDS